MKNPPISIDTVSSGTCFLVKTNKSLNIILPSLSVPYGIFTAYIVFDDEDKWGKQLSKRGSIIAYRKVSNEIYRVPREERSSRETIAAEELRECVTFEEPICVVLKTIAKALPPLCWLRLIF